MIAYFWQDGWPVLRELLVAIAIGLLTGLYSGLIVARVARFAGLQSEAKRLVQSLNWIPDDPAIERATIKSIGRLNAQFVLISSELYFLKHKDAGNTINTISADFVQILGTPRLGEKIDACDTRWQKAIRMMQPNWCAILSLRPRV
jgi:hypothetical protein